MSDDSTRDTHSKKPLIEQLPDAPVNPRPSRDANKPVIPLTPLPKASIEQQAEADRFLRDANLLRKRGELKQSLEALVKGIEIDPGNIGAHILRGEVLTALDRFDEATEALETAKSLSRSPQAVAAIEAKIVSLVTERKEVREIILREVGAAKTILPLGTWSIFMSALTPGLGQALTGQPAIGITLIALTLIAIRLILFGRDQQALCWSGIGLYVIVWVASLVDIISRASKK
jgi:tetratricopeptide (TPR) repeat protein